MSQIQVLESHVADLIAAGEVVERPASVVKELMENAIDAGAKSLAVEITHGGMASIRVTDDGCGIPPLDAETAFLRHATSKLRTEYDLEAIGTLGFRGEALAAIAAVSRIELTTRMAEHDLGVSVGIEGGVVLGREDAGCPVGTTMVIRDLFFNTPARLKYMKKDAAEGAAVFATVQREALAHPEVSVQFTRDGRQELHTPGDGQLKSAVYSVLGRDMALGFTPIAGSGEDGITITGFASLPVCCKGSRGYQYFFVNGRFIRSRTMMAAVEEAYQNQKMVGKFPGCVLHMAIRLGAVDVNVHPAKTEVKFVSERRIFDAVYHAVKGTLDGDTPRPIVVPGAKPVGHDTVTPNQTSFRTMTAAEYRSVDPPTAHPPVRAQVAAPPPPMAHVATTPPPLRGQTDAPSYPVADFDAGQSLPLHDCLRPPSHTMTAPAREETSPPAVVPAAASAAPPEPEQTPEPLPWQVKGEVFHTYILVEQGDTAFFIDKHAAHERMKFDQLKATGYTPMVQLLLTPVAFTPPAEEGAVLLQQLPLLEEFGFEVEDFGGGALLVRQAPDYVDAGDVEAVLTELAEGLLTSGQADPQGARDALLATMACKAAIKGGQKNGATELLRVAEAVMRGDVRHCPHGRPVLITLPRGRLEKLFKRA